MARPTADGLTHIELDGGGEALATAFGDGRVAASVYPWEITLLGDDAVADRPAHSRLRATVTSIVTAGSRARVSLSSPQPLVAEIAQSAVSRLGLRVGSSVMATWRAADTRIVDV
jgi:molybdopterin-binding protein